MFARDDEIDIRRVGPLPDGPHDERIPHLRWYEASTLYDASVLGLGLWRWFVDQRRTDLVPVHPTDAQFEYICALQAVGRGDPTRRLEDLKLTALFDAERQLWRWSDISAGIACFDAHTQLKYVRTLCAVGQRTRAAMFLNALRQTTLYDGSRQEWLWFIPPEGPPITSFRLAGDQLEYVSVLLDLAEPGLAHECLERLRATPLFDVRKEEWVCAIARSGDVADPRRLASDQLDYATLLARLSLMDAGHRCIDRAKMSNLYAAGQWRVSVDESGSALSDERRTSDLFRYVHALVDLSYPDAYDALLAGSKLFNPQTAEWQASINGKTGISSPLRLSADQLRYVCLLKAVQGAGSSLPQRRELPIMRNF